jgi:hypothetical protein
MDVIARIRAEVDYPEDGEAFGFDVIERYIEALEAHARAMEMLSVPPQPRGAVEVLDEVIRALEADDSISLAHLRAVRKTLAPPTSGGQ